MHRITSHIPSTSYAIVRHRIVSTSIIFTFASTSNHITSYHITSHHITSHHIIPHHIASHPITSYHITSHHITSHHIISHHIASHRITSHHIISHHITSIYSHTSMVQQTATHVCTLRRILLSHLQGYIQIKRFICTVYPAIAVLLSGERETMGQSCLCVLSLGISISVSHM